MDCPAAYVLPKPVRRRRSPVQSKSGASLFYSESIRLAGLIGYAAKCLAAVFIFSLAHLQLPFRVCPTMFLKQLLFLPGLFHFQDLLFQ